jgi:hypothetical protein|tara:strand:+ start:171 stop:347 length:177 start_codon:yes stop_codon:yes gene_type:complete
MHWDVGIQIGEEHGQITVQPHQVKEGEWKSAVELALEMAQATHPNEKIEFLYVKEWQE